MFFAVGMILAVGLFIELLFAWLLLDWKNQLGYHQRRIEAERKTCYACLTGGSVLPFSAASAIHLCPEHKARWHLIHDLEREVIE